MSTGVPPGGEEYVRAALVAGRPKKPCPCRECVCELHTYAGPCIWCRNGDHARRRRLKLNRCDDGDCLCGDDAHAAPGGAPGLRDRDLIVCVEGNEVVFYVHNEPYTRWDVEQILRECREPGIP